MSEGQYPLQDMVGSQPDSLKVVLGSADQEAPYRPDHSHSRQPHGQSFHRSHSRLIGSPVVTRSKFDTLRWNIVSVHAVYLDFVWITVCLSLYPRDDGRSLVVQGLARPAEGPGSSAIGTECESYFWNSTSRCCPLTQSNSLFPHLF